LAYIFVADSMGLYRPIFIQICAVSSKRRIFSATECVLAVQGHPRSSEVDDFGTNRKRVCDFLSVFYSNFGPILHRFRDTATYWLKIACFSYLSHSAPSLPRFTLEFRAEVNHEETIVMGATVKTAWSLLESFWHSASVWGTDGQTYRQTDRRTDLR